MGQETTTDRTGAIATQDELKFRRHEAWLGFWKVVLGTFIVGLAGVLIPGFVNFYSTKLENVRKDTELKLENERKESELRLSQQAAHQQYIKDFFATAINQDIELRIRFAHYFANLSGPGQEQLWKNYLEDLQRLRDGNRETINELEKRLVDFKRQPDQIDNAEFDRINRELAWANMEIGYVPTERSTVIALADSNPIAKKVRLYKETTDLVQRLASGSAPLSERPGDLARFWDLYRKDLIGVESPIFSRSMVKTGRVLKSLNDLKLPPNQELGDLADELVSISQQELADFSQVAVQNQQQQQLQQQEQQQQQQQQQVQEQQQQQQQQQQPQQ